MRPDYRLYLVTDTAMCAQRGVPATVAAAVRAGVSMVQLRDPGAGDTELITLGRQLIAVLAGTGVPLLINDRVDLVEPIGAAGAHIGQGDLDPLSARRILGPRRLLGLSVQTLEHVHRASRFEPATVDYLGVGPVFAQATKPDAAAPGGVATLASICAASPWPCVAIGGVDHSRARAVRAAGAAGMAVVSAVCAAADVEAAVSGLLTAWEEQR